MGVFTRAIRPPDLPNDNDPADVPPATVGGNVYRPGDPNGVEVTGTSSSWVPPTIVPSPWSGWPAVWNTPNWDGRVSLLTDTAWMCLDLNSSVLATMSPYLVGAAPSLDADWLVNPDPDIYTSIEEFLSQLFWDFQGVGEAFVLISARYATGWPARFRVLPPWMVKPEMDAGRRFYSVGDEDRTDDVIHIRYKSTTDDAHGHGPLEVGAGRLVAAQVLARYATTLAAGGGIPSSILTHPEELTQEQSLELKAQWVQARMSGIGEPAVLSGGIQWTPVQTNPKDMALLELSEFNDSRVAALLKVPPYLIALSQGDPTTYVNATGLFDFHWRSGLRPMAQKVMPALSQRLLPRGTRVELNRDEYVQPGPYERAQTAQLLNSIVDSRGNPALSVDEIREAERLDNSQPTDMAAGVLR